VEEQEQEEQLKVIIRACEALRARGFDTIALRIRPFLFLDYSGHATSITHLFGSPFYNAQFAWGSHDLLLYSNGSTKILMEMLRDYFRQLHCLFSSI
jgi:hypothetical protein